MDYIVDMQVGYYEDNDTYHGPFQSKVMIRAESLDDALRQAQDVLHTKKCELSEPENMTDGVVLSVLDEAGKLRFDHAFGILKEEATRATTEAEASRNILARLRMDPEIGRRFRRAFRAAGIETVKELLGPVARVVIAAVEAWNAEDLPRKNGNH